MVRKMLTTFALAGVTLMLLAGPAAAFDCINVSRSDTGNAHAAGGNGFTTFGADAQEFFSSPAPDGLGLCPAGADYLYAQLLLDPALNVNWLVSAHTVQAGGLFHAGSAQAQSNQSNGKGIDHIDATPAVNDFISANIGAASALCV